MVVFGYMRTTQRKRIKLYTKLGGTFVGYLKVPDKSKTLESQFWALQSQAAQLCPHFERPDQHVVLFFDNLPIRYDDMWWRSNTRRVFMEAVQNAGTMHMMWDETKVVSYGYTQGLRKMSFV